MYYKTRLSGEEGRFLYLRVAISQWL